MACDLDCQSQHRYLTNKNKQYKIGWTKLLLL